MPTTNLVHSPLAGGPTEIFYREFGAGRPLIFLHGGWGYEIYPLSNEQTSLPGVRLIAPDRSGYGRSSKPALFGVDLHPRAAHEMLLFLKALAIQRCILWGHSDGAVIACWMAMLAKQSPEVKIEGLILEALHYDREKPHSRDFFIAMARDPDSFGEKITSVLAHDHGEQHWRAALIGDGESWLEIARTATPDRKDVYDGRLSEMREVPVAVLHGAGDPRTEPGEIDRVRQELPQAEVQLIPNAGHSPHSNSMSREEFTERLHAVLRKWG
ncbi:MAG TPA: alpha/beta hydrolase [Candidatus Limnocylindrales bacterium]|nr:alpha/beta hydrolase [Candidatus Limnocylindrales bacterium]